MDDQIRMSIHQLVQKSLEGEITSSESKLLSEYVLNSEYARYYLHCLRLSYELRDKAYFYELSEKISEDNFGLELLAHHEKVAPAIYLDKQEPEREVIQKVIYKKQPRKISKFTIFSGVFSAAAILFVVLFIRFTPERYGVEVATLVDQMNAKWTQTGNPLQNGDRLLANDAPLNLQQGIVKIQYDEGVDVCIEGPALFEINKMGIYLEYGRLYSHVSKTGLGFTVKTSTSQFIDLGTEFGLQAGVDGSSELHVIKGKVQMFVGPKKKEKTSLIVTKDKAVRYNAKNFEVHEIPIAKQSFVRSIDSETEVIWRGQMQIDLADIVAGRDGFQKIDSLVNLDPVNGEFVELAVDVYRKTNQAYNVVANSTFIDGVFVPDGELGPVQITSLGLTFDCPDTSGIYTHYISAYKGFIEKQHATIPPVIINGQEITNEPIVMLHSNVGITFDLQAIRKSVPQLNIKSLKATGIPTTKSKYPELNFWILVDGQIKYEREVAMDSDRGPISFNVELSPQERFLTLIVTDAFRAIDGEVKDGTTAYANDFFYLIKPELCVTDGME